jgi:hypothetical protein
LHATVPYPALRRAVRALRRYTPPYSPLLYLEVHDTTLTLTASTGGEIAQVDLPGAVSGGWCALAADAFAAALTAVRPADPTAPVRSRRTAPAAVDLRYAEDQRLRLSVAGAAGGTVSIPASSPQPPRFPTVTGAVPIADGPVGELCGLLAGVGQAAVRGDGEPLAVVRLSRRSGARLLVEATDRHRAHRADWGKPGPVDVDAQVPVDAVGRAVRLLRLVAEGELVSIDADDYRLRWQTLRTRITAHTTSQPFPDLDALHRRISDVANLRLTVDRPALLAALTDAITGTAGGDPPDSSVVLEAYPGGSALEVRIIGPTGEPTHRQQLPATVVADDAGWLWFDLTRLRAAVAFLTGPTVGLLAPADPAAAVSAICLSADDRHALVATRNS